jgi:hypothetical protein
VELTYARDRRVGVPSNISRLTQYVCTYKYRGTHRRTGGSATAETAGITQKIVVQPEALDVSVIMLKV